MMQTAVIQASCSGKRCAWVTGNEASRWEGNGLAEITGIGWPSRTTEMEQDFIKNNLYSRRNHIEYDFLLFPAT